MINDDFEAGRESLEVGLFSIDTIPWQDLAFTVVHDVLQRYRQDQQNKQFPFRVLDIYQPESRYSFFNVLPFKQAVNSDFYLSPF